jgi:TonB family protein
MKCCLIIPVLVASLSLQAQKSDTLLRYFFGNFEPTSVTEGTYPGKVFPVNGAWEAIVSNKSGQVLMTGRYRDKSLRVRDGLFHFYYPTGRLQVKGTYASNRQTGNWLAWYENGQVKDSVFFSDGNKLGPSIGWHANGRVMHEGFFFHGLPDSSWTWYYPNGNPSTREKYHLGKLRSLECFDSTGASTGGGCSLEVPPTIPGRYGGLQKYIVDSLYYPKAAMDKNIQGIVEVQFTITKAGKLTDIRFLNAPDKMLADEVTRVLESIPYWYPAILHNQVVDFTQSIKIPFFRPGSEVD